jgi:hypothetical protein
LLVGGWEVGLLAVVVENFDIGKVIIEILDLHSDSIIANEGLVQCKGLVAKKGCKVQENILLRPRKNGSQDHKGKQVDFHETGFLKM